MKKARKILSALLAVVMVLCLCQGALAAFEDTDGHWAQASIDKWSSAGVIGGVTTTDRATGKSTSTFSPDANLTRGDLAKALNQIFDWDKMAENKFYDLKYAADGKTYLTDMDLYESILKAYAAGVVTGTPDYKVMPFAAVTRQDACVMLCRAFGISADGKSTSFTDNASISTYALGAVAAMSKAGYVAGYADGSFRPQGNITRAEFCALLDKLSASFTVLTDRLAKKDAYAAYKDITVATVPTYKSGWVETDASGKITTASTGTKDLIIRFWYPENVKAGEKVPLLIYTHGGAWLSGDRSRADKYMVNYMLEHGVAVASLTYRLEQEAVYPYSMYDLQAQIRYLRLNADALGIDAKSFGITGSSAGGYWAAQMAVTGNSRDHQDPGYVTFPGDDRSTSTELQYCGWQYGCCNMLTCFEQVDYRIWSYWEDWDYHDRPIGADPSLFGTDDVPGYSFTNEGTGVTYSGVSTALLRQIWRDNDTSSPLWWLVERFESGSPIFSVDKDDPPFFFYHGTADPLCPVQQAVDMYGALIAAGVKGNEFRLCEGMGHGQYMHPQYYLELLQWMVDQAQANK